MEERMIEANGVELCVGRGSRRGSRHPLAKRWRGRLASRTAPRCSTSDVGAVSSANSLPRAAPG